MEITRKETKEVEVVDDIICNRCGKSCETALEGLYEAAELIADWGYGSSKDGERSKAHLCEECFDGIVAEFVIPLTANKLDMGPAGSCGAYFFIRLHLG